MKHSFNTLIAVIAASVAALFSSREAKAEIKPFRESYICTGVPFNNPAGINNLTIDVKFGFSMRRDLFSLRDWTFFFGYTHQSIWHAYDYKGSFPFYDNSFMPGLYAEKGKWLVGFEHCSNGRPIAQTVPVTDGYSLDGSRGMNYLYAQRIIECGRSSFLLSARAGVGVGIGEGRYLMRGVQDPLLHYLGYVTVAYRYNFGKTNIYAAVTPVYNKSIANVCIIYDFPILSVRSFIMFNYGYEALLDFSSDAIVPCNLRFGFRF